MGWGNSSTLQAYLYFNHAFSGLSTNSNNHIMPHTIINYTNEHNWAGFNSTFLHNPTFNLQPVQISSKMSTERGIKDKTVVITDRGIERN